MKIGKNIDMLVCFLCVGTQDRILVDINHHYQITINIKIEYKYIKINIFTVSAAYLFKSFCHISSLTKTLQVFTHGRLITVFYFTRPVDRKQTTV